MIQRVPRVLLAVSFAASMLASDANALDFPAGELSATFAWAPADGPVQAYEVWISFNESGVYTWWPTLVAPSSAPKITIAGRDGESLRIKVRAISSEDQGPFSSPSQEIRFSSSAHPPGSAVPVQVETSGAIITDFDGDGVGDTLHRDPTTGQMFVSLGGDPLAQAVDAGLVGLDWEIAGLGDFDGNGLTDLLWRHAAAGVHVWLNSGLFSEGGLLGLGNGAVWPNVVPPTFSVTDFDWQIQATGDFNGDGRDDVLWRSESSLQMLAWLMDGFDAAEAPFVPGALDEWGVDSVDDFDSNGFDDIEFLGLPGSSVDALRFVLYMDETSAAVGFYDQGMAFGTRRR